MAAPRSRLIAAAAGVVMTIRNFFLAFGTRPGYIKSARAPRLAGAERSQPLAEPRLSLQILLVQVCGQGARPLPLRVVLTTPVNEKFNPLPTRILYV